MLEYRKICYEFGNLFKLYVKINIIKFTSFKESNSLRESKNIDDENLEIIEKYNIKKINLS